MKREHVIRWLYRGGQAAIVAELLAILGAVILVLVERELVFGQGSSGSFEARQYFVQAAHEHRAAYSFAAMLLSLPPAGGMLIVIWAWHCYLEFEGIHLLHWIATSIGLIGCTLRILFFAFDTALLQDIVTAIDAGQVTYQEAYGTLAAIGAVYNISTATIFGAYPLVLLAAAWEKRLLPMWFVIPAIGFALINDVNMMYGSELPLLSNMASAIVVLWPFLFGVVMLTKAQKLATDVYIETHGTPPTPTRHIGKTPSTQ